MSDVPLFRRTDGDWAKMRQERCSHDKTWDQDCPECAAILRADRIASLRKKAAEYGFRLVPLSGSET